MSDLYTFTWHPQARVLEITLVGLWTTQDVHRYYAELLATVDEDMQRTGLQIMTDLRQYKVQPPEVADLHVALLTQMSGDSPVTREAWIVQGVVQTMQFTRGAESVATPVNVFTDRDAAWLSLTSPAAP